MADTAIRPRIATVSGVFLRPGMSKNRRLYTTPMIIGAVKQMQADLGEGGGINLTDRRALDMGTHHDIGTDGVRTDILRIVGKVTSATVDEQTGVARFTADIPDTAAGRDIAALVTPEKPYVKGVSFLGNWTGPERIVRGPDGQPAETAEGFVVKRIDYTNESGILGAEIDSADLELTEGAGLGKVISESAEEVFLLSDTIPESTAAATAATGAKSIFADNGYLKGGQKHFPLGTRAEVRSAWATVSEGADALPYTAPQIKRMKSKIQQAAQRLDFDVVAEASALAGEFTEIVEAYASVNLDNGPGEIRVAAYVPEPSQLAAIGERLSVAALAALAALDPDNDGDIDLPGGAADVVCPNADCGLDIDLSWTCCPFCTQVLPVTEANQAKEPIVAEATTTAGGDATSTQTKPVAEMNEAELRAFAEGVTQLAEANAGGGTTTPTGAAGDDKDTKLAEAKQRVADAEAELKAIEEGSATSGAAIDQDAIVEAVASKVLGGIGEAVKTAFDAEVADFREAALAGGHLRPWRKGLVAEAGSGTAGAGGDDYDPAKATPAEFDAHRGATYARMLGIDSPAAQAAAVDAVAATA